RPEAPNTVMLSYSLWQGEFGGDTAALGRKIVLDGKTYVIIGVMPRSFFFPSRDARIWTGMRWSDLGRGDRGNHYLQAIGRLRPGVPLEQARAQMQVVAAQLSKQYPQENRDTSATLVRVRDELSSQSRLLLEALSGAALCVLLIACTNLANL